MKPLEYRSLRELIGSQPRAAELLNIPVDVLIAREEGRVHIDREAALAIELLAEIARQHPDKWKSAVKEVRCTPPTLDVSSNSVTFHQQSPQGPAARQRSLRF